jgi:hypothetical protein
MVHVAQLVVYITYYWCSQIYFACFHSVMKYGAIFWGDSCNSVKIFTLQKKFIRIMAIAKPRNSCRSMCKRSEIVTFPCEYIFSLMNLIVNNQEHFQTNSVLRSVSTGSRHNLLYFQKRACYCGIKNFDDLPCSLKSLTSKKVQFKAPWKILKYTLHLFCWWIPNV